MSQLLTVSKAAQVMGCHPETIRRLNRRGVLPARRDYRGFRLFDKEKVIQLKRKRETLK